MAGMNNNTADNENQDGCHRSGCDTKSLEFVSVLNLGCVGLSGSGLLTDPLRAEIVISPTDGNLIECTNEGLFATAPLLEETVSTLTQNSPGVFVYTDETGLATVLDICRNVIDNCDSTLTANPDGSFSHVSNGGFTTNIPAPPVQTPETITTLSSSNGVYVYTSEDASATTIDVCADVAANCDATLVANADGSFTHTSNGGVAVNIPAAPIQTPETVTTLTETDGVYVYTSENGIATTIDVCADVAANCNAALVLNVDGSFTHTANDGTTTSIPAAVGETVTTFVGVSGVYAYTSEDGTATTIDVCADVIANCNASLLDNGDGSFLFTSNDGSTTGIPAAVGETVTTLTANGAGVYVYSSETSTLTTIDVCADVAANCNATLALNVDGSVTHTDNAGTLTTIPAPAADVTTTLVETGTTGVYTYTNELAIATIIDVCADVALNCNASLVVNVDGSVTHTDNAGIATTIPAPTLPALQVLDTNCIDMTLTGVGTVADPWIVSADPILSPDDCNNIECRANGLFSANTYEYELMVCGNIQTGVYTDGARPTACAHKVTNIAYYFVEPSTVDTTVDILVDGVVAQTIVVPAGAQTAVVPVDYDVNVGQVITVATTTTAVLPDSGMNLNLTLCACAIQEIESNGEISTGTV